MSSNEDNPRASPEGLRRSKRVKRTIGQSCQLDKDFLEPKVEMKHLKKLRGRKKLKPGRKPGLSQTPKKEESSEGFNGASLTPAELHQLFMKFKRDGHFRPVPQSPSSPPLVIHRTMSFAGGNSEITKIECHKPNGKLARDLLSLYTPQMTEAKVPREGSNSHSLTLSTPPPEDSSASPVPTSTTVGQFIRPREKISQLNKNRYTQTASNTLPNILQGNFDAGNGFSGQLTEPHPAQISPGPSFSNSARQTLPARLNHSNQMFLSPSSTWTSPMQSTLQTQHVSNAPGIHRLDDNAQWSSSAGTNDACQLDRGNSNENLHGNVNPPNFVNRYDCSNFDAAAINDMPHQQSQANAQNSTFPPQDPLNSPNEWSAAAQTSSNAFAANTSTIPGGLMTVKPENSVNYMAPGIIAYNLENGSVNDSMYVVSPNTNSSLGGYNGYFSSFPAWNNVQLLPNSHFPMADQSCVERPMNSWSTNYETYDDFLQTNGNATGDSSSMVNLQDSRDTGLRTIASSGSTTDSFISSVNNGISYDNYMGGHLLYTNENSELRTQENKFTLPSVASIKPNIQSWYNSH